MKTLISILITLFCITNANAQTTWTKIQSGTTVNLNDVLFPEDISKGYIVGNYGKVIKTMNACNSLDSLIITNTEDDYQSINSPVYFNECILTGYHGANAYSYKSLNGGISWDNLSKFGTWIFTQKPVARNWICKTYFPVNLSQGYGIYAKYDKINVNITHQAVKTLDGGTTWTSIFLPKFLMISINFFDNNFGYIVGYGGNIYRTTNAGIIWDLINFNGNTKQNLNGMCYLNKKSKTDWIIVGDIGTILKTTDGGTNWRIIPSGIESNLKAIKFCTNGCVGVAVGEGGKILSTRDGGDTWTVYTYPSQENLNAISIPPNQYKVAYIVGSNGIILKTINLPDPAPNCTPISVEENANICNSDINISPNPATDNITISFTNSELSNPSISIFNSLGIEMMRFDNKELLGQSSVVFSTEEFPVGMYYCIFTGKGNIITKSFIILR
jgi:photosystem II stability/assembly factor-like uncharacterized protein